MFSCTIGYSRLFLGVHSLNQILFGGLIGLWSALTLHYIVKDQLIAHLNDIMSTPSDITGKTYTNFLALMAAMYAICLTAYYTLTFTNDPAWSVRIEAKCGAEELEEAFEVKSLTDFGEQAIGFGAYLGYLYFVKSG